MAQRISELQNGAVVDIGLRHYGGAVRFIKVHSSATTGFTTLLTEQIIDFKAFDAREVANPNAQRALNGSNNYYYSNLLRWLNSTQADWYAPASEYDASPTTENVTMNSYDAQEGFLSALSNDTLDVIAENRHATQLFIDEVVPSGEQENMTQVLSRVYLPSLDNLDLRPTGAPSGVEGTRWAYFINDLTRRASAWENATLQTEGHIANDLASYWTRTNAQPSTRASASALATVNVNGRLSDEQAQANNGFIGVRPAVDIKPGTLVSDEPNADGVYQLIFNNPPLLQLTSPVNALDLFEGSELRMSGTVEEENDDAILIRYRIDSSGAFNLKTYMSTGEAEPFDKVLTLRSGVLMDGAQPVISLVDGAHALEVWAEEASYPYAKSNVERRTFTTTRNRPPVLKITKKPTLTNGISTDTVEVSAVVTDLDSSVITLSFRLNDEPPIAHTTTTGAEVTQAFVVTQLTEGLNTVTVTAIDDAGLEVDEVVRFGNTVQRKPSTNPVTRVDVKNKGAIDNLVFWGKIASGVTNAVKGSLVEAGANEEYVSLQGVETVSDSGVREITYSHSVATQADRASFSMSNTDALSLILGGVRLGSGDLSELAVEFDEHIKKIPTTTQLGHVRLDENHEAPNGEFRNRFIYQSGISNRNQGTAFGRGSETEDKTSLAMGYDTRAESPVSFAGGEKSVAHQGSCFAFGQHAFAGSMISFEVVGVNGFEITLKTFNETQIDPGNKWCFIRVGGIFTRATIRSVNGLTLTLSEKPDANNKIFTLFRHPDTRNVGYSSAIGYRVVAVGDASHAEGYNTTASGDASHAEGITTTASGDFSHAEGYKTTASGGFSHAEGSDTTASGNYSHAEGSDTTASGGFSHAEGYKTTASGGQSHAEGYNTTASGGQSHAEGSTTTASGNYSHAEGYNTTASGDFSHAEGSDTTASGGFSHAGGRGTTSDAFASRAIGTYNKIMTGSATVSTTTQDMFVVGNGTVPSQRANAFRVTAGGRTYGLSAFNSTGADYAEYFEWADGNVDGEDRVARFVTLDAERIRYATSEDDYILGITSTTPALVGDSHDDDWKNRYVTDLYGRFLTEEYEVKETSVDENGEEVTVTRTHEGFKYNPHWDDKEEYVPRSKRKEWSVVGMMGKLYLHDDGTCEVNAYARPKLDGIATHAEEGKYRVVSRVATNLVKVVMI